MVRGTVGAVTSRYLSVETLAASVHLQGVGHVQNMNGTFSRISRLESFSRYYSELGASCALNLCDGCI